MLVLTKPIWYEQLADDPQLRRCMWIRFVLAFVALHFTRKGGVNALAREAGINSSILRVACDYHQGGTVSDSIADKIEAFIGPNRVNGLPLRDVLRNF